MFIETKLGGDLVTIHAPEAGMSAKIWGDPFFGTFPPGSFIGLDTETTSLDHFADDFAARTVQLAVWNPKVLQHTAFVLDVADPAQREAAAMVLGSEQMTFCSHSPMDVLTVARTFEIDISHRNVDTLTLASMAHTQGKAGRDLKELTGRHVGPELQQAEKALDDRFVELWADSPTDEKGKRSRLKADREAYGWRNISTGDPVFVEYAGLDAVACRRVAQILVELIGCPPRLLALEAWLAAEANRMQLRGMRVDLAAYGELQKATAKRWTAARRDFGEIVTVETEKTDKKTGEISTVVTPVSPASPKVKDWFAEHGVEWDDWAAIGGQFTDTGAPSLEKDLVPLLREFDLDEDAADAVDALIEFKAVDGRKRKLDEVDKKLHGDRIHPKINTIGATATARMSSSGPNFQNFSRDDAELRGMFLPDPGHVLISADFSTVELRVAAALAGESKMIDAIVAGDDLHQLTADLIGVSRQDGKTANFSSLYGVGPDTFGRQIGKPRRESKAILQQFWNTYTKLDLLRYRCSQITDVIVTPAGRRLEVGVDAHSGEPRSHANLNYLVQSTSKDVLSEAWYRFATEFRHAELVWLPIHDEIVVQAPEDAVDEIADDLADAMTMELRGVPIACEVKILRDDEGVSRWGK